MAITKIWTYSIPQAAPQVFQTYRLGADLKEIGDSLNRSKAKKLDVLYDYPWSLGVLESLSGLRGWVEYYREAVQVKLKYRDRVQLWPMDEFLIYRHKTQLPVNAVRQAQLLSLLQQTMPEAFSVLVSLESHAELKNRQPLHLLRPPTLDTDFVQTLFNAIERPAMADVQRVNSAQLNELNQRAMINEVQVEQLILELQAQLQEKTVLEQQAKKGNAEAEKALKKELGELRNKLALQAKLNKELQANQEALKVVDVQIKQLQAEMMRQFNEGRDMKREINATVDLLKRLSQQV